MSELEERIENCRASLLATCREAGAFVTGDGRVGEQVVAELLLGIAVETLSNQRAAGAAPPHYRLAARGHRVTYQLQDVARYIVGRRIG